MVKDFEEKVLLEIDLDKYQISNTMSLEYTTTTGYPESLFKQKVKFTYDIYFTDNKDKRDGVSPLILEDEFSIGKINLEYL